MGWADPGFNKFTASKAFFSKLFPKKSYTLDANLHGGERAFVLSGQYEKYLPMDILPVYLLKAILANDIDKMEELGIYEIVEEDLALCEYACTSKIKVQDIVRQGLDLMMKELG
jgi:Na+-transporting NADH:ubiquinone oxidoreductase subunit A